MNSWWTDYIEIPFRMRGETRRGADCWGLARLVYREQFGIVIPALSYETVRDAGIAAEVSAEKNRWRAIDAAEPFALALYEFCAGTLFRYHVGIMIDEARMLHIKTGANSCVEPIRTLGNQFRGFWLPTR